MKTLKKFALVAIAGLFFAPAFQSCKKGEEDPGLSLRSRKARLAGEWTLTDMTLTTTDESTSTSSGGTISSNTTLTEETFDGTSITEYTTYTNSVGGTSNTSRDTTVFSNYSKTITIEKDGTFKSTSSKTYEDMNTYSSGSYTVTVTVVEEISGTWDFNEGVGESASKERVFFFYDNGTRTKTETEVWTYTDGSPTETDVTESVLTYSYTNLPEDTWLLTKLANDEIIVDLESSFTGNTNNTFTPFGGTAVTNSSSNSYTAVGSFTATQE